MRSAFGAEQTWRVPDPSVSENWDAELAGEEKTARAELRESPIRGEEQSQQSAARSNATKRCLLPQLPTRPGSPTKAEC